MDARTRPRGSSDTAWTGHLIFALLSIVLHIIPVAAYFGSLLLGLAWFSNDAGELEDHATIIPIEFGVDDLDQPKAGQPPEAPPIKTATLEEPTAPSASQTPPPNAGDAGAADAADAQPDAPADALADVTEEPDHLVVDAEAIDGADALDAQHISADARPEAASDMDGAVAALPQDGSATALAGDAGPAGVLDGAADAADGADGRAYEPIRDPVAVAGGAQLAAQKNPNVSLMVFTSRIRRHPLASRHAATLTSIQQWRAFFEGTGLDPLRDTDWINVSGPQFRSTAHVAVVLRYGVPEAKMRAAINALVARSQPPGTWGEKNSVKFARLKIDNADRFIVLPQPHILVVVPPDGLEQAVNLRSARFPSGEGDGTAVLVNLKTPRNAFHGLPADIPASIAWVKFSMKLTADGGADARIDAEDSNEQTATQDAAKLTEQLEKAAVVRVLFVQQRLFDPVVFRAEGKHIRAETHFSQSQLNTILSMIGAEVDRRNQAAGAPSP